MNVSMWAKAVKVIPRVSKEEWTALDVISRWLIATRSAVLVMTFISAAIAGLLSVRDGHFAVRVYSHPRPAGPPPEYPPNIWPLWFAAFAFQHTRRFGSLFLLGLAADVVARKIGLL